MSRREGADRAGAVGDVDDDVVERVSGLVEAVHRERLQPFDRPRDPRRHMQQVTGLPFEQNGARPALAHLDGDERRRADRAGLDEFFACG